MAAVALLAGEDMREGTTPETERLSEGISPEESEFGSDEDESTDTEEVPQVT